MERYIEEYIIMISQKKAIQNCKNEYDFKIDNLTKTNEELPTN